ncbi:MAG: hypothetical protein ACXABD_01455 [Candidatus Thorarchaeota archaeon]|jgi:hypothetical protein
MDTDINNYTTPEIVDIVKIHEDFDFETLYERINKILAELKISGADPSQDLRKFFIGCFDRLSKSKHFAVPENILLEYGMIKLNEKRENSTEKYSKEREEYDKIVKERSYPYSLPTLMPNNATINTTNTKYPRGNVNPVWRETIKNLLTVNSKFRDDYREMSTDFVVNLNEPYSNVISMKLASLEFLNSYYTFSNYLRTNRFNIKLFMYDVTTGDVVIGSESVNSIVFPEGNYSAATLQSMLNTYMITLNPPGGWTPPPPPAVQPCVEIYYLPNKGKLYWKVPADANLVGYTGDPNYNVGFDLDFDIEQECSRDQFSTFGWLVGFRHKYYSFFDDYKSVPPLAPFPPGDSTYEEGFNPEAFINFTGTSYYLLEVLDYNRNTSEVVKYETSEQYRISVQDILAKVPNVSGQTDIMFEDSSDRIFKERNYFGPVRIKKLRIRLLDENGKVVNLNNSDITVSFEVETLDVPYKNMVK